jgi:hypothetical protein
MWPLASAAQYDAVAIDVAAARRDSPDGAFGLLNGGS